MSQQPEWELVGTIGDVDPLGYGGGFVFRDKTGVYDPEVEYVEPIGDGGGRDDVQSVTVYRVTMEAHTFCDDVLSDNKYHPEIRAWYAKDLNSVCRSCDYEREDLIDLLCSDDPMYRVRGYEALASYYGWHEFDHYHLTLTPSEAEERYSQPKYKGTQG